MVISYHGAECFKISQGDITLALNPISKDSKLKPTRFGADITLITTNHPDFNGRDQTSRGDKSSFVIDGPGEYEIKDIFIKGFLSEGPASAKATADKPDKKINTIYLISFEGMNLCFLGALTNPILPDETLEAIEDVDILFVPIGVGDPAKDGASTLDPVSAYKLAVSLEPSVIIPMYYQKTALEQFIKEGGEAKVDSLDRFVVKKKDLEDKKSEIVVLKEE
ncbi:MAG: Zn-dependent hydrolase of the metallo-beta-lactamase superfamily [Parcubacteria group bacterium GW2011_GWA2_45_15]|nr:MAG: Zn-dependent hydrolase of the metallo-beta-lactamase superfamily [Parcubacteria group bacterium GW2011_GWA2_45_15]